MAKQQWLWQQQHQPEQRSTPSRVSAVAAGPAAASPLWCSVTTNALFDSTPGSASAAPPPWSPPINKAAAGSNGVSPVKAVQEAAAAAGAAVGASGSCESWGSTAIDFQPLRASLGAVRASQQQKLPPLQAAYAQQQQQQQLCAVGQLLRQLQEEMQQWFVAYVDGQLCQAQAAVSTRGDCVELLKALTHAQQWIQQQQQPALNAAASTSSAQLLVSPCSPHQVGARGEGGCSNSNSNAAVAFELSAASATAGIASAAGHTTSPPAAAAGSLSPAAMHHSKSPGLQLQQLQVSLRKSLCHLGFLRFQLPS
jgi:hypothetical protein